METNETKLSHEQSLLLIERMINTAKNRITENGFHFMLWGVLVIAASIGQYFWVLNGGGNETNILWIVMPAIGVPAGLLYEWKRDKRKHEMRTIMDGFYGKLWLGFGISLGLTIFTASYNNTNPLPYILMLMGLATFLSGCLYRFSALIIGGIIFWAAMLGSLFIAGPELLLLNAGATFLGYIVPGLLLWRNAKQATNV